jgi:hypothetical protein
MRIDWLARIALVVIAVALAVIAFRPLVEPAAVRADSDAFPFYIEPGFQMLRYPDGSGQVYGKVMIDLRNGKVWGFPNGTQAVYPIDTTTATPPTSLPIYLGRYAFGDTNK